MSLMDESVVEDAVLSWVGELGYGVGHGPQMAPAEPAAHVKRGQARNIFKVRT